MCALPPDMAPEVQDGHYDSSADVFSFGMLLYEMVFQENPFISLGNLPPHVLDLLLISLQAGIQAGKKIAKGERPDFRDEDLETRERRELKAVIESCWDAEPSQRPDCESLVQTLRRIRRRYGAATVTSRWN